MLYGDYLFTGIKRSRRRIVKYYLPKLRGRQTNFSRPFQPCVQVFRERGKVYPNKTCKSVVSEQSFILVCLILHPRVRGGVGGGGVGTLMKGGGWDTDEIEF